MAYIYRDLSVRWALVNYLSESSQPHEEVGDSMLSIL